MLRAPLLDLLPGCFVFSGDVFLVLLHFFNHCFYCRPIWIRRHARWGSKTVKISLSYPEVILDESLP